MRLFTHPRVINTAIVVNAVVVLALVYYLYRPNFTPWQKYLPVAGAIVTLLLLMGAWNKYVNKPSMKRLDENIIILDLLGHLYTPFAELPQPRDDTALQQLHALFVLIEHMPEPYQKKRFATRRRQIAKVLPEIEQTAAQISGAVLADAADLIVAVRHYINPAPRAI
ncbi:hypothetical protein D4R52_02295 [bacterium]|nr:MAG: hypothetical protein D4R52_02295 [bacterium]